MDSLVKMRRLPAERMLDAVIRRRALVREDVRRLAILLASFYRESRPERLAGAQYLRRLASAVRANEAALAEPAFGLGRERVQALHEAQHAFLARRATWLTRRAEEGRIVEGHGDLRPEHVCLLEPPVVFDRLEFNRQFRLVDPADELASLDLECERLGETALGVTLLRLYEEVTGDQPPPLRCWPSTRPIAPACAPSSPSGTCTSCRLRDGRSGRRAPGNTWRSPRNTPSAPALSARAAVSFRRLAGMQAADRRGEQGGGGQHAELGAGGRSAGEA